ncbi:MAG: hypothetical protein ACREBG_00870 [Pyrinomonadaceae bacterium]
MKRKSSHFVLLVTLLIGFSPAYGQDPLGAKPKKPRTVDDYESRTLKEVAAKGAGGESRENKEDTMIVYADILPSRVRAIYRGSVRPLPQIKREVLRQWARLYAGFPEGYTEPYESEVLFSEGGSEYWLAVRKKSLPHFQQKLKKGEAVDLYLIRVGAAKASDDWELMLLIESFKKAKLN